MTFGEYIHTPQRKNPLDFDQLLSFILAFGLFEPLCLLGLFAEEISLGIKTANRAHFGDRKCFPFSYRWH